MVRDRRAYLYRGLAADMERLSGGGMVADDGSRPSVVYGSLADSSPRGYSICCCCMGLWLRRWRNSHGIARRLATPIAIASSVVCAATIVELIVTIMSASSRELDTIYTIEAYLQLGVPVAFVISVMRRRSCAHPHCRAAASGSRSAAIRPDQRTALRLRRPTSGNHQPDRCASASRRHGEPGRAATRRIWRSAASADQIEFGRAAGCRPG